MSIEAGVIILACAAAIFFVSIMWVLTDLKTKMDAILRRLEGDKRPIQEILNPRPAMPGDVRFHIPSILRPPED